MAQAVLGFQGSPVGRRCRKRERLPAKRLQPLCNVLKIAREVAAYCRSSNKFSRSDRALQGSDMPVLEHFTSAVQDACPGTLDRIYILKREQIPFMTMLRTCGMHLAEIVRLEIATSESSG